MLNKKAIRKPISIKIFVVIMLVILLQGVALFLISSKQFRNDFIAEKKEDIQAKLINLQEILQYLTAKKEFEQIQKTVASLGSDIYTNKAFLLDDNNNVIASTRITFINKNLDVLLPEQVKHKLKQFSYKAKRNLTNIIWQSDDGHSLYAISPIILGRLTGKSLRSDKIGIMFFHYDMKWINKINQERLFNHFLPMMLMLSIAGLGLSFYFNVSISRRIKAVNNSATLFSEGDYSVRIKITNNDEITDLALAFNTMAEELLQREQNITTTLNRISDAEEALKETNERLYGALSASHTGTWRVDLRTGYDTRDALLNQMLGLPAEPSTQSVDDWFTYVHPDEVNAIKLAWEQGMGTGLYAMEHRLICKDGQVLWVYDRGRIIRDDKGQLEYAIGAVIDITERKKAEDDAQQRDIVLDTVFQAIPDLFFLMEPDGTILEHRTGLDSRLYTQPEIFQRKRMQDVLPKSVAEQFDLYLNQVKESNEMVTFEYALEVSQQLRHWEARINQLPNRPQLIAIVRDITSQHNTQQILLVKEQEQRGILNSMVDAVITLDETGSIISFNKTAETLFGYSFEEVLGQNINRLMPAPFTDEHEDYLKHYIQTGSTKIIEMGREVEGLRKNKETFPMRLSIAELPADETGKRRFISTCQNLTFIKQQEEQLRRSQKMDALGKLTGGIAHDFNNILSVVQGYSDLLKRKLTDQPKLAGYADQIHHAGERGAKLTAKLLSFSRLETPKAAKLNINTLLQMQQDMLQKTLTVRIKLVLDLADEVWPIWLDNNDLEDAILNMSINAMHAMKDKKSNDLLSIRTCNQSLENIAASSLGLEPGDYVQLSLTDTGCGMDEATKEKIFDPFFTTKGEKGTGLGLSQVFGFVKRTGGTIKVYSELSHGTEFVLYFPRYFNDKFEETTVINEDFIDLRGEGKILVVDDEPALRELASELLIQQGYQVLCAENGQQALNILEHEQIDLMLSDVIMPKMDGYQLAAIAQKKYPSLKIQLCSGFTDERYIEIIDESLHQNLLYKPYNPQNLFKNIRVLLSKNANLDSIKTGKTLSTEKTPFKPLKWTDTYSVGVSEIDKDHKVLLSLLNRCIKIANGSNNNKKLMVIFDELAAYTQYHFQREERIMKACECPQLSKHKKVHQLLIKEVQQHQREYEQGNLTVDSLLHFLYSWLNDHILGMDQSVASYYKGKEKDIQKTLYKQVNHND